MLVSCWLRVLIGHRVSVINVVEWKKSCWNHFPKIVRVQKNFRATLLINRTVMMMVVENPRAFFTESGNLILFSVDYSDFCRRLSVESETTIKICRGHDVFLVNELHKIIKRNSRFEILTTIWYETNFWTQDKMNCKLWRIIRKDLGFIVVAHCSSKCKSCSISTDVSTEFWSEAGIDAKIQQWLGTLVAGRSELLLLRTTFEEWIFRVAKCCF